MPVHPDLQADELEILGEKVTFLERTGFDRLKPGVNLELTILGGYERLLEHIAVHRYYLGLDWKRDIGDDEAVLHWYDTVYAPLIEAIRRADLLDKFPGRTEADLYLWVIDHQHYLREHEPEITPQEAADDYADKYGK